MSSTTIDPIQFITNIFSLYGFDYDDIRNEIANYFEQEEQFKEWILDCDQMENN
jgi:hypothetical protein